MTERRNVDRRSEGPLDVPSLLAGLRDPGPVPPDLRDRINASLAASRLEMAAMPEPPEPSHDAHAAHAGLCSWLIPAAAAGVLALGGGGAVLASSLSTRVPSGSTGTGVAAASSTPQTRFRHTESGRRYTWAGLESQARELWTAPSADPSSAGGVPTTDAASATVRLGALGAIGLAGKPGVHTLAEAQRCLTMLGETTRSSVVVDEGRLDRRDVTVIATGSDVSGWTVAVVRPRDCTPLGPTRHLPPTR